MLAVNVTTALAAVGASIVAYLGVDASRAQIRQERNNRTTEEYRAAVADLQAPGVTQRVSGVLTLRDLASQSRRRKKILPLLCDHVRQRAPVGGEHRDQPDADVSDAVQFLGSPPFSLGFDQHESQGEGVPVVNLSGTDLTGVNLRLKQFDGAVFQGATLTNGDLRRASLRGADFSGATLRGAELQVSILTDARFVGAHLERSDFTGSPMEGAALGGAHLSRALLGGVRLDRAGLAGTDLTRADLEGAHMVDVHAAGATFRGAYMSGANLTRAELTGADLTGADLNQVVLAGTNLFEAKGLKLDQINSAILIDYTTRLPRGFRWTGRKVVKT
ncbi:pentapeptide repeat-containing protein [Actinomadura terrae]|uniref:pentapeptide repeat-containing protein n=1 Tax=Actinomadura terrae TaxID=604353 RepID=UPI001FA777BE|nr:pentapeptide repeat-containing protein [Actinomadura terrae]